MCFSSVFGCAGKFDPVADLPTELFGRPVAAVTLTFLNDSLCFRAITPEPEYTARMMKAPWIDPALRELLGLAALAAFGCGLALAQSDRLSRYLCGR